MREDGPGGREPPGPISPARAGKGKESRKMRRHDTLRLAAVGLALAVPLATRAADPPDGDRVAGRPIRRGTGHARHLCPTCQMKAQMEKDGVQIPPPPVP